MSEVIRVDDLEVEVRRSTRRRTVDLIVDRAGGLVATVPAALDSTDIKRIIHRKRLWIYATLGRKEKAIHPKPAKEYVTGEGFHYLGKKYQLVVLDSEDDDGLPLRLKEGRFVLRRAAAADGREHFVAWYTDHGKAWIANAVALLKERVAAMPRSVGVRDLGYRWGSCTRKGDLYFHWRTILLPAEIVRYLILHELVHLDEHSHSAAFYQRLGRVAPEHRETDLWLERNGDRYFL